MKMRMKYAAALVAAAFLGGFLLPHDAANASDRRGGGGHFGGGHFGGARFGGGHFSGGRFGGAHFNAMRGMHSMRGMGYGGRHFSASNFGRSHLTSHNTFSRLHNGRTLGDRAGLGNAAGRINAGHNMHRFGNHQALQQASLSRHNAFFNRDKFGGNGFDRNHWHDRDGWHGWDWHGNGWGGYGWYGYRWYGPVFWPYFWGDYFSFAFWPYDYYDVYWGYGPDVILWGAFWPYGEFYYDDAYAYNGVYTGDIYAPYRRRVAKAQPEASAVAETCAGFAPGVSDLPIQKLEGIIDATEDQRTAFEDLKAAAAKASDILRKSCPSEAPLTPVARLDAMEQRLQAMEEANAAVKEPFVRIYSLLTEEQKQRLEAVSRPASTRRIARTKELDIAGLCSSQAGFTAVPADQIASTITLNSAQQQELEKLRAASAKASDDLKSSCPSAVPNTLDGRLDAAQQRVAALIQAVDTVRPAVREFYTSLTDEQKAALSLQPAQAAAGSRG